MHEELQKTLQDEETISTVFKGPIHQTKQDCLLALTNLRAIVVLDQHPAFRKRKGFVVLSILRSQLSFAQRENFGRGHLYGVSGPKFGTYVDGFTCRLIVSSRLSKAQQESFDLLLIDWGGQMESINREQALERRPGMFEYNSLPVQILGSLVLVLFFGIIFIYYGLTRGLSRCQNWLGRRIRRGSNSDLSS